MKRNGLCHFELRKYSTKHESPIKNIWISISIFCNQSKNMNTNNRQVNSKIKIKPHLWRQIIMPKYHIWLIMAASEICFFPNKATNRTNIYNIVYLGINPSYTIHKNCSNILYIWTLSAILLAIIKDLFILHL